MILKISKGLGHKCPRPFYIAILKLNVARESRLATFALPAIFIFIISNNFIYIFIIYPYNDFQRK